jgi:diacylglycerol kinase family enzyme
VGAALRIHAIVNCKAGSALNIDTKSLESDITAAFTEAGYSVVVETAEPADVETRLKQAKATAPDVILVGGGDGTVRSAAQCLLESGIALAVLPMGTLNRMARDLNIPLAPADALKALAGGSMKNIDAAEVNGRIFLCNSLIGLPPKISMKRQRLRGTTLWQRVRGYFRLLREISATRQRIAVLIDNQEERSNLRVLSLAVSNNLYSEKPSLVLTRPELDHGRLGIYISKHRSGMGMLGVLIRAALGFWDGDPNLDKMSAERLTVRTTDEDIKVSNDGEVETLKMPLQYRIHAKALKVLAPATAQKA